MKRDHIVALPFNNKGLVTIEASIVFIIFVFGYIFLNNLAVSSYIEFNTKKAISEMIMDLSNYSQIIKNSQVSDIFISKNEDKLRNDMVESLWGSLTKKEENSEEIKGKTFQFVEAIVNNKLREKLFATYLRKSFVEIIGDKNIGTYGIVNGSRGLDFTDSVFLEDGKIKINLSYKLALKTFSFIELERSVQQSALIDTNVKADGVNRDVNKSIWQEDNFTRGKYFAKYMRNNTHSLSLREGIGLDFYNPRENMVSQMFSMNLFSKMYSENISGEYVLKEENLKKQIVDYCRQMEENILNSKGEFTLSDGQKVKAKTNLNKEIIIVIPREASRFHQLRTLLESYVKTGYRVKLVYKDEALI